MHCIIRCKPERSSFNKMCENQTIDQTNCETCGVYYSMTDS